MTKQVHKAKRLFEQFQPEHYELHIKPDAKSMTFTGTVTVAGKRVGRPSKRITLHQKGLAVMAATVEKIDSKKGNQLIPIDRINTHNAYDEVRLHSPNTIYPGHYKIRVEFSGNITPNMQGLYPCNYTYKGKDQVILATQFESHHAREVFPCIDEPEAKATFDLIVTAPAQQTVISNMPVKTSTKEQSMQITKFDTTPKMSVYLLAFAVGDIHYVETKSKGGVIVRSWASVAQPKSHLEYSTKEAADILDFFAEYFGIPYPLPKLDQLALPDFDSAAMENWGLVTYREMALLVDPKNRSISNEQFITLVIAHELSHQWFGNLVTMKWWDDLWLNESFAGLMEHVAPAALHPDWNQWELYALSDIALITSRDSYKDIQPVGVEVHDPELIHTIFDPAIVYAKGARLLKMLRDYIGEDAFRAGLQQYFKTHAYSNTVRSDLWDSLSATSKQDINTLMTPWLTQPGMPVIHITQNGKDIQLTQERFLLDGDSDGTSWPIPLLSSESLTPDLLTEKSATVQAASTDPILFNPNASGQFISHYTNHAHVEQIANSLAQRLVPPEARINVLNDFYMLTRKGMNSLTDSLDIVLRCTNEDRDSVWGLMLRAIGSAAQLTEGDKTAEEKLKQLKGKISSKWYKKLGWDSLQSDTPNDIQLRHTMLALTLSSEDKSAIKEALQRYETAKTIADIDAEIRSSILATVVKHGNKQDRDNIVKAYASSTAEIQHDISGALASTKDVHFAKELIASALGEKGFVRPQDVMRWIVLLLRNYHTRDITWKWMVTNWGWLAKTLQDGKSFDYLPTYAASIVTTESEAKKYHDLFEPLLTNKTLERNIKIGFADIDGRVAWRKRDEKAIKLWLNKNT